MMWEQLELFDADEYLEVYAGQVVPIDDYPVSEEYL